MDMVFDGWKKYGVLDYVACWFWKGAQYIRASRARLALVATNSISQGDQVATLWPPIFALGNRIAFAYQTFPWANNAKDKAAVHVVIIGLEAAYLSDGLSPNSAQPKLYKLLDKEWHSQSVANISPYLIAGSNLAVAAREQPLGDVPKIIRGNQPTEGGNLILTTEEKDSLIAREPQSAKWIKKLLGSDEFLNGKQRWCLWLTDLTQEDLDSLPEKHPLVAERVERNRAYRAAGSKNSDRLKLVGTPHLFRDTNNPANYILVPCHSSENRDYIPLGFLIDGTISNNANLIIPNATLYEFGILTSAMHNDWMRTVAGRLKSDYRYSGTLVYNNFPWPEADEAEKARIAALAEDILLVRADYPDQTLAQLYDPDKMPPPLKEAHLCLDAAVDRLYRAKPFSDGMERVEFLFDLYEKTVNGQKTP